jgi:hypothetical protein
VFEENIGSLKDKNENDPTAEPSTKRLKTITGPLFKMFDKLAFYEDNYKYSSWKTYGSPYGSSSSHNSYSSSSYSSSTHDSGSTYASSSSTHKPYSSSWTSTESNLPPLRSVYHEEPQPRIYTTNVPSYLSQNEPADVVMDLLNSAGGSIVERDDTTEAEWKVALKDARRLTIRYAARVSSVSLNALFLALKDLPTMREITFEKCTFNEDCVTVLTIVLLEVKQYKDLSPIWIKYCSAPKSCQQIMRDMENNIDYSSIILTTNFI